MNKPSCIIVFATQHMPTGGIESHLWEFCNHLSKSGVLIDLVITNAKMPPGTKAFFQEVCRRVYLGQGGRYKLLWLIMTGLRLRFVRYDSLYTNGQGRSVTLFSKLLSGYKRWVLHHHTSGDSADQATWENAYVAALRQADLLVACSQRNASYIEHALGRTVESIPCFSKPVTRSLTRIRETGKFCFGYYGRLIPEKGIDILCQLSEDKDIQGIEFHIWGEGTAYPAAAFETYRNLTYHGSFTDREQLSDVLGSIDALLLLSRHPEGLPISLLEAMSAGLPWLATDQGGIPDIALDPYSTRVIPTSADYEQIKEAILTFANDIREGRVSAQTQLDLYTQKFSPSILTSQWRKAFGLDTDMEHFHL